MPGLTSAASERVQLPPSPSGGRRTLAASILPRSQLLPHMRTRFASLFLFGRDVVAAPVCNGDPFPRCMQMSETAFFFFHPFFPQFVPIFLFILSLFLFLFG